MSDRLRERIRTCLHPGSKEWDELDALVAERDRYKAALTEIAKAEGAFSRDPLTHATNTIENMRAIAEEAVS